MLGGAGRYFYDRRRGLAKTAGLLGAAYLAGQYAVRRLEEIREKVVRDNVARENLRRRFQQNQQDCTFHIEALLPTLATNILEELDVEGITLQLQRARTTTKTSLPLPSTKTHLDTPSPSISLSALSTSESESAATTGSNDGNGISEFGGSSTFVLPSEEASSVPLLLTSGSGTDSWVEQFIAQENTSGGLGSPASAAGQLYDSMASISVIDNDQSSSLSGSLLGQSDVSSPPAPTKSKAELWKELKILTFTRVLTIIYVTSLLSLQTHIQLNLIGRHKYVESVRALEREEKLREKQAGSASIGALFWGESASLTRIQEAEEDTEQTVFDSMAERKYLTMSWWILNVGWKEVADRVREGVERVFESVSLKAMLSLDDVERLLREVREKVENGDNGRINFVSAMFPTTEADEDLVLLQGGLPPRLAQVDPTLRFLLDETKTFVRSADFALVLGSCLDKGLAMFIDGMRRNIFEGEPAMRVASLLPGCAKWCHLVLSAHPTELIEGLSDLREVAGFSAIIFSSYEEGV